MEPEAMSAASFPESKEITLEKMELTTGESKQPETVPSTPKKVLNPENLKSLSGTPALEPMLEDSTLPEGWKRTVSQRVGGSSHRYDVYIHGFGKQFRSKPELERYIAEKSITEISADDIDFTVWGKGVRPPRTPRTPKFGVQTPVKEKSEKKQEIKIKKGEKKKLEKKKAKTKLFKNNKKENCEESTQKTAGTNDPVLLKFNFKGPQKRKRNDSEISIDLEELENHPYKPATPTPKSKSDKKDVDVQEKKKNIKPPKPEIQPKKEIKKKIDNVNDSSKVKAEKKDKKKNNKKVKQSEAKPENSNKVKESEVKPDNKNENAELADANQNTQNEDVEKKLSKSAFNALFTQSKEKIDQKKKKSPKKKNKPKPVVVNGKNEDKTESVSVESVEKKNSDAQENIIENEDNPETNVEQKKDKVSKKTSSSSTSSTSITFSTPSTETIPSTTSLTFLSSTVTVYSPILSRIRMFFPLQTDLPLF